MKALWELIAMDRREDLTENASDDFSAQYGRRKKLSAEIQRLVDDGEIGEDTQGRPLIVDFGERKDKTLIIDALRDGERVRVFIRNNKTVRIMSAEDIARANEQMRLARTGPPSAEERAAGRTPERARRGRVL